MGTNQNALKQLAKKNRKALTDAEKKIWNLLRECFPYAKFRRQHPIDNYIVDFVCLEKKLIIECDGGQHTAERDAKRTKYLENEGFTVLRFWNNDILRNIEGVFTKIDIFLKQAPSPNPLPSRERD